MPTMEVLTPEAEWVVTPDVIESHYSALNLHRKCPQAWFYRYEMGLRSPIVGPAPHLRYGSWWGVLVGVDALERGRKHGSLVIPPRKIRPIDGGPEFDQATVTVVDVLMAAKDWWEKLDPISQEVSLEKMGETTPRRLRNAFVRWKDEYGEDQKNERPLGLEVFWKRALPVPDTHGGWEDGSPAEWGGKPGVSLLGYIDQIYFDVARGMVVCRDDKFLSSLSNQTALDDMMDSQLQLYPWGVDPLLKQHGIESIKAISYDRVKSVEPSKPQVTGSGGLSKSVTQYDVRTYREWAKGPTGEGVLYGKEGEYWASGAKKGLPKWGYYTEDPAVVERLSAPQWRHQFNARTLVPYSRNIARAHLRAAYDTATDIWTTQNRAAVALEAARNLSKDNCRWCDYAAFCRAQMVGGPEGEYDLREFGLEGRGGELKLVTLRDAA